MRELASVPGGGVYAGSLPDGCQLCIQGAKLVVFVTGKCSRDCFYCPISQERRDHDTVYANERPISKIEDIILEAETSDAEGASLTGGEPLEVFPRTISIIRMLKQHFGSGFHIHLYTGVSNLPSPQIQVLQKAGLDELRLHNIIQFSDSKIIELLDSGMAIGIEIPLIPGKYDFIIQMLERLERILSLRPKKQLFLNLNELEASETNISSLQQKGFTICPDSIAAIDGSKELAMQVLNWNKVHSKINVHFCPSSSKDTVQLRNRFLRRAKKIRLPFEHISNEGLLTKGVVMIPSDQDITQVYTFLLTSMNISETMLFLNKKRNQIEFDQDKVRLVANLLNQKFQVGIIEEHPTWNRLQMSFSPA